MNINKFLFFYLFFNYNFDLSICYLLPDLNIFFLALCSLELGFCMEVFWFVGSMEDGIPMSPIFALQVFDKMPKPFFLSIFPLLQLYFSTSIPVDSLSSG